MIHHQTILNIHHASSTLGTLDRDKEDIKQAVLEGNDYIRNLERRKPVMPPRKGNYKGTPISKSPHLIQEISQNFHLGSARFTEECFAEKYFSKFPAFGTMGKHFVSEQRA